MRWWAAFVLAGCYAPPAAVDGALCGPPTLAQRCPSGQVCAERDGIEICTSNPVDDRDAAPPDACIGCTSDDSDGDTVPNAGDNCPDIANLDQDDEDTDGAGDACDPCPPFDDTGDTDGDGLPDSCDPRPNDGGDILRVFAGLARQPPGWSAMGFSFDGSGDATATAGANQGAVLTIDRPAGDTVHVWMDGTLVSIAGTALGAMGVATEMDVAPDDNVVCQLVGNAAGATQKLRLFDNANGSLMVEADHPFAAGTRSVLRVRQTGTSFQCNATGTSIASTSAYKSPTPTVGARVRSATVRYHWIMVITSP